MSGNYFRYIPLIIVLVVFFIPFSTFSKSSEGQDSLKLNDSDLPIIPDSVVLSVDSLVIDSLVVDSVPLPKKKKAVLDATVNYQSTDSIIFTGAGIGFLFGEGKVTYEEIALDADFIRMNMDSNMVYATGRIDSLGAKTGYPIFKDGGDTYNSESILYNFDTGKGYITNVITEQGEGYITASQTKKMPDGSFFMADGKYTTCDNHDHPHFYINLTKAKVRPKKNVVAGPAYLVIEDVPLPLALPFGFFPFTSKYSSGIIMPTYGDDRTQGFYLRDGGYYFALSDYIDLAITGEIYTKGSWGLKATSSYAKRYKFRGAFDASYKVTVTGDKIAGDYQKREDFKVNWRHSQDAKANPNQTFSASVDFSTTGYNRNSINGIYNTSDYTQNTKSSTVNYSRRFFDGKLTLNANARINQRSADSTIQVSLPTLSINTTTIYPFKRKNAFASERWYEKISFSYQGMFDNQITTKEDELFQSSFKKDWVNAMQHTIPIQASFVLFNNINITPSFTYKERWYGSRIDRHYDQNLKREMPQDTIYGFNRLYDYNFSVGASTQIYGFFKPLPIFGDKVEMIRHTFRPNISFSMTPDFGDTKYGYYKEYIYNDPNTGELITRTYSPYQGMLYGVPSQGKSGTISFGVDNTLEMKIKSDKDSTGIRKISLIDRLSISSGYNLVADSLNWSDISATLGIKVTKSYNLIISANFDPYTYEVYGEGTSRRFERVNKTQWEKNRIPGRLTRMSFTIPAISLNNDTFKKKKDKKEEITPPPNQNSLFDDEEGDEMAHRNEDANKPNDKVLDSDGYVKWEVPWNLNINYNIGLVRGNFNYEKKEYDLEWNQSLSFGGNIRLSKNWNFSFNAAYDFDKKEIGYGTCSISRDLHCWTMSAQFVPFGDRRSYNFMISVKSSLLKDLKWDQRSSSYSSMEWY